MPLLRWQIGPTYRSPRPNDLVAYLRRQAWFPAIQSEAPGWQVVSASSAGSRRYGDAWILSTLINLEDHQGDSLLLAWSQRNTSLAQVFWPIVLEAARLGRYDLLPKLLRTAQSSTSPSKLRRDLLLRLSEPVPHVEP
jgi:hypothetical protein